jgi:SAM-dependent methyltransferase
MTLLSMARRRVGETRASFLPSLRPGHDDRRQMAESLAALYAAGASVAWPQVTERWGARRVEAPTYPFQRQRHWFDDRRAAGTSDAMWAEAAASAEAQSGDGPLDLSIETQTERSRALDRLATTFIASALSSWRLFTRAGESHDVEDIMARCAISPIYRRLMERWCDALAAEGVLERRGDAYVATAPLPPVDPEALVADMRPLFGRDTAVFDYVARAGAMAADVVTGRESGLETLFPGGSDQLADRLYRTSPTARYLNAIVRAAVHGALGGERQLRILEIGAGTGATTAGLLPTLPASRTTYCFTDVGARFLTRARERFAAYPFLEYRLFDAEAPPAEQGLPRHGYDLVIAANVLHATRDLDDTLANVRALLAPHGILVLLEATEHPRWFDVTTGLIGGWQRFEDKWRGSHPLLTPQAWSEALAANGFDAALAFPSDDSSAAVLGQRVILARGPGGVPPRAGAAVPTRAVRSSAAVPTPAAAGISLELQELSEAERGDRLVAVVRDAVVRVLGLDPGRPPDRRQRLLDLGVDSLMALEIRDILTAAVGAERRLPSTLLFEHPTIDGVAAYLERTVIAAPPRPAEAGAPSRADDTERVIAADVDALSDAEVEALINQRLERM